MAGELRRFNKFKLPRRSLNFPIQKTRAGSSSSSVPSSREAVCRTRSTLARTLSTFNCWEKKVNGVLYNQTGLSNDHRQICTRIAPLCVCTCIHTYVRMYANVHMYVVYACVTYMVLVYKENYSMYVRMYVHMLGQHTFLTGVLATVSSTGTYPSMLVHSSILAFRISWRTWSFFRLLGVSERIFAFQAVTFWKKLDME